MHTIQPITTSPYSSPDMDYVDKFNQLLVINAIDSAIANLRGAHASLADRASIYVRVSDLPNKVEQLKANPISIESLSIKSFSFGYLSGDGYLDNNLQLKTPSIYDLEYPTTTTQQYVTVAAPAFSAATSVYIENVLDTSGMQFTDVGILYNSNGTLSVQKTIPLYLIYGSSAYSGFPPGSIVRWNGGYATNGSWMPPVTGWGYPTPVSQSSDPFRFNTNIPLNTNLWASTYSTTVSFNSFSGGAWSYPSKTVPAARSVNWFSHDTASYRVVGFDDARGTGYSSPVYYGDYNGRRCLNLYAMAKLWVYNTPMTSFCANPSDGLLFDFGIRFTQASFALDTDNSILYNNPLQIMSYEDYGSNVIYIAFQVHRVNASTYKYYIELGGMYFSGNVRIECTLAELNANWCDIALVAQDGKFKVFKNKTEITSGNLTGKMPRSDTSKMIIFDNGYRYNSEGIWDPLSTSRWYGQTLLSIEKIVYGTKDIYSIDWTRTDNSLYKSKEQFKGLSCDREWTPNRAQYRDLYAAIGNTFNTAADNTDGTIFRLPVNLCGKMLRCVSGSSGVNTNVSLRTNGDNLLSRLEVPLLQSHTHVSTTTLQVHTAGNSTMTVNYSTNTAGVDPIVVGMGSTINTSVQFIQDNPTGSTTTAKAKTISEQLFVVTGK